MVRLIALVVTLIISGLSFGIEGYLVERYVISESPYGSNASVEKEYVTKKGIIRESEKGDYKSTTIMVPSKGGIKTITIDHKTKTYTEMEMPSGMILMGLMMMAIECPQGQANPNACRIKKVDEMVKLTGKSEKVGKWKAREAIMEANSMMGKSITKLWLVKDPLLIKAQEMTLSFYKKLAYNDPKIAGGMGKNMVEDVFKSLKKFLKKYGASVKEESFGPMQSKTERVIKSVKKVNVPESMFKPPKGYTKRSIMGHMMMPPGGSR